MPKTIFQRRFPASLVAGMLCLVVAATTALTAGGERSEATSPTASAESLQRHPDFSVDIVLTPAELSAWQESTATAEQRAGIVANMQEAFAGVAQITASSAPAPITESSVGALQLILAYGVNATHFWITASYADMARGAIWVAVRACISRGVPAWVCNQAGNTLSSWARGWGSANNHGLWAAVYWAPPRFTGGRW